MTTQRVTNGLYAGVLSADRLRMTITRDGLTGIPAVHVATLDLPAGATPNDLLRHLDALGWVASRHTGWSPWGDGQWCLYFTQIPAGNGGTGEPES